VFGDVTFEEEVCDECEEFTIVSRVSDHDPNIIEYSCRNRDCNADWIEPK